MNLTVVKSSPELVRPIEPTPSGDLPLSFMDRLPTSRFLVDSIHVYSHGKELSKLIKESISKALVPYYPMAGRFKVSDNGELVVACTSEGILFIEASADFSLSDANYFELPLVIPKEHVLPYLPHESTKDLIFLIQVTQFKCGGFLLGIRSDHAMAGGSGICQFMQVVVEMAHGLTKPTIKPIWGRNAIPNPPKHFNLSKPPILAPKQFQTLALDITPQQSNQLKDQVLDQIGLHCSTFDVLLAKVWRARARAVNFKPGTRVRVGFAASTRHLLKDYVPIGYYGNCGYPLTINASSDRIANASFVEVVKLIREAKNNLPNLFSKWMEGDEDANPFSVPPDYDLLAISDWSKLGFHDLDYGFGKPLHVAPVDDNPFIASCIFLKPLAPKLGMRLIMRCVVMEHFQVFKEEMLNLE